MADLYYHMWVTVTSLVIIVLVFAYIIHDRLSIRYEALAESEREQKMNQLNSKVMTTLGVMGLLGGGYWFWFLQTHEIYITKSLRGFHDDAPALIMAGIGLIMIIVGIRKKRSGVQPD
jgi:hypothetical protein